MEDSEDEMTGRRGQGDPKKKRKVNVPGASSALFEKVTATFNKLKATLANEVFEAQTQLDAEKRSDQPAGDDRAEITARAFKRRAVEQLKALAEVFLERPKSLPEGLLQQLSHGLGHDKQELSHGPVVQVLLPGAAGNGAEEAGDAGKGAEEAEDDDEAGEADEEVQGNATKAEEEHQQEHVSPMDLLSQALATTTKAHGV